MIRSNLSLLETPHRFIAHGCNSMGVMGSGVAKLIRDRYPLACTRYKEEYYAAAQVCETLPLGLVIQVPVEDKVILNMITQQSYGKYGKDGRRYVSYDAVDKAFMSLRNGETKGQTIAIPKIGCGLGGGHWPIVFEIIQNASRGFYDVELYCPN